MPRRHMSHNKATMAVGWLLDDETRHVAYLQNVSQSVIQRLWQKYLDTGTVARRPQNRRPKSTSAPEFTMALMAKCQRFDLAVMLNRDFERTTGVNISAQTFRNRLHNANLFARRPAVHTPLTTQHRVNRLAFARDLGN